MLKIILQLEWGNMEDFKAEKLRRMTVNELQVSGVTQKYVQ